jgi:hypothetical protein
MQGEKVRMKSIENPPNLQTTQSHRLRTHAKLPAWGEVPTCQIGVYIGEDHRSYHLHLFLFLRHHFCIFIHIRDTQEGKSTKVPYAKTAQKAPPRRRGVGADRRANT